MKWQDKFTKPKIGDTVFLKKQTIQACDFLNEFRGCEILGNRKLVISDICEKYGYLWYREDKFSNWIREDGITNEMEK